MTQPSNYPLWAWRLRLAGKALITYDQMNWHNVNRPYGPKPSTIITVMEAPGYPYPSTTVQRRRPWRLQGHRGVGPVSVNILQNGVPDENGKVLQLQVGIWRGLDGSLAKALGTRYTGEKLREVRAIKGVGRPWLSILPG